MWHWPSSPPRPAIRCTPSRMFPSSNRAAAALAAVVLLAAPALAQNAPRSAIPWIESERQQDDPGATVQPAADPDVSSLTADPDSTEEDEESLVESLDDAIIGVTPLPTPLVIRGLDPAIWPDLPPAALAEAIATARLTTLHAANRLLIEILLTPVRDAPGTLAGPRSAALLAIGAAEDALAAAITAPEPDGKVYATLVQAGLLLGKGEEACAHAQAKRTAPAGKAGIFCLALTGPAERTSTVLEAAIRAGMVSDAEAALFDAVIDPALLAYVPEPEDAISVFEIGLRHHLDLLPKATEPSSATIANLWPFLDSEVPQETRTTALGRLEALGLVATAELAAGYAEPSGGDADSGAPTHPQVWHRLLEAAGQRSGAAQAQIAEAGLLFGRVHEQEGSAARLLAPAIRELFPSAETAPHARVMQRLFLLAADPDNARIWVPIEPDIDESLLFAVALEEVPGGWNDAHAGALAHRYKTIGHTRDGQLLAALAAFGRATPPAAFAEQSPAELVAQLNGKAGAVAALVALNLLADRSAPPGAVQAALAALAQAGFPRRARQIATEVVLLGL